MRNVCGCKQLLQPLRKVSQWVSRRSIVIPFILFVFGFLVMRASFLVPDRHFALLLDLIKMFLMSPAVAMWKTKGYQNLTTIQGQQEVRYFPSCREHSSLFFHDFVPGSEVSSSRCLINLTSYWRLQFGIAWLFVVSNVLLFIQSQYSVKLNRILYFWLVQTLQDHFFRYFTCCQWSLVPSCRNLERHHSVSAYWTDLTDLVQLRNLRWPENAHWSCK